MPVCHPQSARAGGHIPATLLAARNMTVDTQLRCYYDDRTQPSRLGMQLSPRQAEPAASVVTTARDVMMWGFCTYPDKDVVYPSSSEHRCDHVPSINCAEIRGVREAYGTGDSTQKSTDRIAGVVLGND